MTGTVQGRRTLDRVRGLFQEGAVVVCVENTKRPELNGKRWRITRVGKSYCECVPLDGPGAGRSFRMALPLRAADVLEVGDVAVRFRLDDTHTLTLTLEAS